MSTADSPAQQNILGFDIKGLRVSMAAVIDSLAPRGIKNLLAFAKRSVIESACRIAKLEGRACHRPTHGDEDPGVVVRRREKVTGSEAAGGYGGC